MRHRVSYEPAVGDIRTETVGDDGETEAVEQYEIYMKMLGGKDPKAFEKEVKEKFIKQPEQMKLLIVVDKLLTGFELRLPPICILISLCEIMAYSRQSAASIVWMAKIRNLGILLTTKTCFAPWKMRLRTIPPKRLTVTIRKMYPVC